MKYRVEIEWTGKNFSAYSPDVPGCVAVGDTREECKRNMQEALAFHLEGMLEDGLPIPQPEYVDVPIAR